MCEKPFKSLNSLAGRDYMCTDDLESLGFCLIYFATKAGLSFDWEDPREKRHLKSVTGEYYWIRNFIEAVRDTQD
jgi:hypothetical protein